MMLAETAEAVSKVSDICNTIACPQRDSNSRHAVPKTAALPLSYEGVRSMDLTRAWNRTDHTACFHPVAIQASTVFLSGIEPVISCLKECAPLH